MKTDISKKSSDRDEAEARLEQRILAIPGVELVGRLDPAEWVKPKTLPSRSLLFSKVWLGFGVNDDQVLAAQVFEKRIGHKPEFVYQDLKGQMLWVGPV